MATLTGQQIDGSYQGLIKTTDNGAISGTAKAVTDGLGNATNIEISNTSTNFVSGTVDFTGSTVSGLPTSSAGLVTGGQTNSMKSAAALTTTAAVTSHVGDIVIGEDAESKVSSPTDDYNEGGAIAIGVGAVVDKVVDYNFADTKGGIALGINAKANSGVNEGGGIAIGENSKAEGTSSAIAIGSNSYSRGSMDIAMGHGATANSTSIAIGKDASANSNGWGIAIGESAGADAGGFRTGSIAVGTNNSASALDSIVIGNEGSASAAGAVALGHNVVAATADTVSVSALEVQTDSTPTAGGIIISDAGGTDRRLNIDASGALQIDSTAVGGGGAAGLVNGTGTDTLKSAASLTTNAAVASGNYSIALGEGASATRQESVAIGQNAQANGSGSEGSIAIGAGSVASANRGIAIGINGTTNSSEGIVIGDDVDISSSDRSVAIGGAITITGGNDKVAIGTSASVSGQRGLAFGQNASATANEAIAIGYNVTAAKAQTLSVNNLETLINGGGITMHSPNGTEYVLTVSDAGALVIT